MTIEQITNATYAELKTLAKENGIKANQKKDVLVEQLTALVPSKTKNAMPKEYWAIYRAISKKNPNLSNKAVATRARYAYQKRYAQATVEAE